ncbi:unnamed protein product [Phytophthora fragariaefolia]|uniref:Unnamed protein product n=1 Tax=Phytophthora fragariaefolia TaxID=1490495 RepID=A0A9W6XP13_9STRA|nr:unnamed protein product [Phytophthora fragariaefolia]
MNSCVLHPPSNRVLRDDVIGKVVQRSARCNRSYGAPPQQPATDVWEQRCSTPEGTATVVDGQLSPTDRKRKRQEQNSPPSSELMLLAVSSSGAAQYSKPEPQFKGGEEQRAAMIEWANSQRDHQREIRRLRQIRYRKKKDDYANNLEEETRQLQQQIEKLEQRRRSDAEAVLSEKTLWNVAVEYFRLFRYGLRDPILVNKAGKGQEMQPCAQLDFLRATMAPDVLFNAGRGVESIMRNWKYFSLWFHDVEIELDGLKKGGEDSLVANITTSFTITQRSLTTVFPHLCTEEARNCRGRDGLSLADKLLRKRITMRGLTRFDWDTGYGRVTSVISESDMLTPMLRILGSLEDVSRVFEKSLISLTPYRGQMRTSN